MKNKAKPETMAQDSKQEFTPKLRFPDFRDEPAWTTEPLRESATVITEKAGERKCVYLSITSGVGLISQEEKFGRTIAGESYKNYFLIQRNDFAYNKSATKEFPQGFIAMYSGNEPGSVPNSIFTCFRVHEDRINVYYLDYLFVGNLHGRWLRKYITVGARAHGSLSINDEDLMSLPIPRPRGKSSLYEQQKIADCLISLDELIAAHGRRLEALKAHKKGLMQQLFPREGETLPRLRFPEFQDAGEWTLSSVRELVEVGCLYPPKDGNHGNLHPKSSDYVANGIPFIMASDLNDGQIDISTCHFISKELADTLQKGFAKEGDVLLSHKGTVGEVAVVKRIETPYLMLTPQVTYYRVKDRTKLSNAFLAQLFVSDGFQTNLLKAAGGGTRSYIGITEQAKLSVTLPKDCAEQQRIADCLTSLDELVNAQTQKFDSLKTHKKGLMQQLLPSTEKVEA